MMLVEGVGGFDIGEMAHAGDFLVAGAGDEAGEAAVFAAGVPASCSPQTTSTGSVSEGSRGTKSKSRIAAEQPR